MTSTSSPRCAARARRVPRSRSLTRPRQIDFDRRDISNTLPDEAYFVRTQFDPQHMRIVGSWQLPPPLA